MKKNKVLITGSNGFLGKNLIKRLQKKSYVILEFTTKHSLTYLENSLREADVIFHFAAIQRSSSKNDFFVTNVQLTEHMINYLTSINRFIPIFFTSSIHASKDSHFGISKRMAEELILDYSNSNKIKSCVIRLPHIFGPESKPNFNNVTATFIYSLIYNKEIKLFDMFNTIDLLYVDDLLDFIESKIEYFSSEDSEKYNQIEYIIDRINRIKIIKLLYLISQIISNDVIEEKNLSLVENLKKTIIFFINDYSEQIN
jgi:UDP-2-acetamido-2,6-beta-L-arabino-hexul-4-ose reductase